MKRELLTTCLIFATFGFSRAYAAEPAIDLHPGQLGELKLPPEVLDAIKRLDPAFQIYEIADFTPELRENYVASLREESGASCEERTPPPAHALPMAVVGDFNGDGRDDVVLLGHNAKNQEVIGVLSDGRGGYSAHVAHRETYVPPAKLRGQGLSVSLTLVESKRKAAQIDFYAKCAPEVKRFETDGFLLEHYGGGIRLFHVKQGEQVFREFVFGLKRGAN